MFHADIYTIYMSFLLITLWGTNSSLHVKP